MGSKQKERRREDGANGGGRGKRGEGGVKNGRGREGVVLVERPVVVRGTERRRDKKQV